MESQEFDFHPLLRARGKSADLKDRGTYAVTMPPGAICFLQAKGLCIDLVKLRKEREALLDLCRGYADTTLRLIERRKRAGASTQPLEVNKTRMEKMSLDAAHASNDAGPAGY